MSNTATTSTFAPEILIWPSGTLPPAGGPDDVMGRAPWERVVQEGLLMRAFRKRQDDRP